jgi:hypothetical protein
MVNERVFNPDGLAMNTGNLDDDELEQIRYVFVSL